MFCRSKSFQLHSAIPKKRNWSALKGVFFAMLSSLSAVAIAIIVKNISLHPLQSVFYRFIGLLSFSIPALVKCCENPFGPKGIRLFLLFSGIFGACSMTFGFVAYRYLPLSEAFVIFASTPIFVSVAAHLFLRELCGLFQIVLLIFTIGGIVLTTKLPSYIIANDISHNSDSVYGFLAAISTVLCRCGQMILIRKAKQVPHVIATFACSWTGVLESALLIPVFTEAKLHRCGMQWLDIVLMGFFSFLDQIFMSMALHYETAGIVAVVKCAVTMLCVFLVEIFLFNYKIDYFAIVGAILISLSVASLSLRKLLPSG